MREPARRPDERAVNSGRCRPAVPPTPRGSRRAPREPRAGNSARDRAAGAAGAVQPPTRGLGWPHIRRGAYAVYVAAVAWLVIAEGVPTGRTILAVLIVSGLAISRLGHGWRALAQVPLDWLPFTAVLMLYDRTRGIADSLGFPLHERDVLDADRSAVRRCRTDRLAPAPALRAAAHPLVRRAVQPGVHLTLRGDARAGGRALAAPPPRVAALHLARGGAVGGGAGHVLRLPRGAAVDGRARRADGAGCPAVGARMDPAAPRRRLGGAPAGAARGQQPGGGDAVAAPGLRGTGDARA